MATIRRSHTPNRHRARHHSGNLDYERDDDHDYDRKYQRVAIVAVIRIAEAPHAGVGVAKAAECVIAWVDG